MHPPRNRHVRACVEIGFIIFLFYANLLMGEFTHGQDRPLVAALIDIVNVKTMTIAIVTAVIGHFGFELMREKS